MLFARIESEGLAHYSYIIGDKGKAVVIDPRRDCDVYIEKTMQVGMRITDILETHRNEDYLSGSVELAARTGAAIWHADGHLDYGYGRAVTEGDRWVIGTAELEAISSPGHTPGSISYVLCDRSGVPMMVFTGDALFAGDVGRVDFLGAEKAPEMAGLLYDTIHRRLLPLGDGTILCPAHGPGSACGGAIADRPWSTLGLERRLNPKLQFTQKEDFVAAVGTLSEKPPYFEKMEEWNRQGPPILGTVPAVPPLTPAEFALLAETSVVLDTRMELSFGAGHVPGALSLWKEGVPRYAGWFLPPDRPVLLVNEADDAAGVVRYLLRIGFENIAGSLAGGMLAWHEAGQPSGSIETVTVQALCRRLDAGEEPWILDVRSDAESTENPVPGATHIHVTQIPRSCDDVPKDRTVFIFCGSGMRSMTAASLLKQKGWEQTVVVLGGLAGWNSTSCPIEIA